MTRAPAQKKCYRVRHSVIHGRGVFAATPIAKGTQIIEYRGERTTWEIVCERPASDPDDPAHTFIFELSDGRVIDAGVRGSVARWINHSCAPNCEIEEEDHRVFIEARRDIKPGEELAYDYNLQIGERHTKKAKRDHACLCGARRCRGTMLGEEERD